MNSWEEDRQVENYKGASIWLPYMTSAGGPGGGRVPEKQTKGVKRVRISENFANVIYRRPLTKITESWQSFAEFLLLGQSVQCSCSG